MYLIKENESIICEICQQKQKNLRGLSQHLKKHNINSKEYTFKYLLNGEIPKCKCGCGKECFYYPFRYTEFRSGHNPDCFWQKTLDKDSVEYKQITEKISKSVKQYIHENPIEVSQETRDKRSKYMKDLLSDPIEKQRRVDKMTETKKRQSEDGILSANHWTKKLTEEELTEKLAEIGKRISIGRRSKIIPAWNKGLTSETDERIDKWSGSNHYKFNPDKKHTYSKPFKNKIYRQFILDTQEGLCFGCGNAEGFEKHSLHHIDEDKLNHKFENLVFVCRSCHSKIHNNQLFKDNFDLYIVEFKSNFMKSQSFIEFTEQYNFNI